MSHALNSQSSVACVDTAAQIANSRSPHVSLHSFDTSGDYCLLYTCRSRQTSK